MEKPMRKKTKIGMIVAVYNKSYRYDRPNLKEAITKCNAVRATVVSEPNSAGFVEVKKEGEEGTEWVAPKEVYCTWEDYLVAAGPALELARQKALEEKLNRKIQDVRTSRIRAALRERGVKDVNVYGDSVYMTLDDADTLFALPPVDVNEVAKSLTLPPAINDQITDAVTQSVEVA